MTVILATFAAISGCSEDRKVCLGEGTLIATPKGQVPVESLSAFDEVYSVDLSTGKLVVSQVVKIRSSQARCLKLRLEDGGDLVVTGSHPILSPETGRYEPAESWQTGRLKSVHVEIPSGLRAVRVLACEAEEETRRVFDITVASSQRNFLANGVIVHNKVLPIPSPFLSRTSPENLLENLRLAYEHKDFEEYVLLFSEDFTFVFRPEDAGNDSLDIPASWGLEQERQAHWNMFRAPDVEDIKLEWSVGPRLPPDFDNADTKIIVQDIFLEVDQRLETGDILHIQARGDSWFHFRKSDVTTAEGDTIWEIVWWEDKLGWGWLKSIYR
jgi:hypothetical protein